MAVASVIVEIEGDFSEAVLSSLAKIHNASVYGIKENQIVTVIEGDTPHTIEETIKQLYSLEGVIGVYPVFAGDYE